MAYREGAAGLLSENQRIRGLISSVIDIVLLIAAYLLANFLRFNVPAVSSRIIRRSSSLIVTLDSSLILINPENSSSNF